MTKSFLAAFAAPAAFLAAVLALPARADPPAQPVHCDLASAGAGFAGGCGTMFPDGSAPWFSLNSTAKPDSLWRDDLAPVAMFKGSTHMQDLPDLPASLEIYRGGFGVLRTEYGWFPVANFSNSPNLTFDVDTNHEIGPSGLDDWIVQRAAEIVTDEKKWNRSDDRRCGDHKDSWSIYCAVSRATLEVTGAPDHRRPALEVVRILVEERTQGRSYTHRMIDYNNDPSTKLDDVKALFQDASSKLHDDAWLRAHGFVDWPPPAQ
jgi:hypothetical protein